MLIDFLLDAYFCILNGMDFTINDFTCITTVGRSAVNYCLVSRDDIDKFVNFYAID